MNRVERLRHWSWKQQGLDRSFESLEQLLRHLVGIYSTNPCGPVSAYARMDRPGPGIIRNAEYAKKVIRMPAMRGSVHTLLTEDAPWIRSACVALANDPLWDKRYGQVTRLVSAEAEQNLLSSLSKQFKDPFSIKDMKTMDLAPDEMLKPMVNKMCFQNKMVRVGGGSNLANPLLYVSMEHWLGEPWKEADPDQSLVKLARQYFRAFGPARLKDFAWWTSLTQKKAREILEQIELEPLDDDWLISPEQQDDFKKTPNWAEGQINILPQWDCYTMGYAPDGRRRLVDDEHLPLLYGKIGATGGNAMPCILWSGKVCAIWKNQKKGKKLIFHIQPLIPLKAALKKQIETEFQALGPFLEVDSVQISYNT